MKKQKPLYHPISLYSIRGTLQDCGVTVGRIQQIASDVSRCTASYKLTLVKLPKEARNYTPSKMMDVLSECFSKDVSVFGVQMGLNRTSRNMEIFVWIDVDLFPPPPLETAIRTEELKKEDDADRFSPEANELNWLSIDSAMVF